MSSSPEQLAVIQNPYENKMVIALPGSGKTHTMVSYADVITAEKSNTILMLTFTNAAAAEMGERVEKRLHANASKRVQSMTFAKLMLQQFKPISNGRKLLIGGEQENYIRRTAAKLKVAYDSIPIFAEFIENAGRMLNFEHDHTLSSTFYFEYLNLLAMFGRVDLNTVTREVILGLQDGTVKPVQYSHIIVDEFQDTDELQYLWLKEHLGQDRYFCVVGDDDQSIYSWRGAVGYSNMRRYHKDFAPKTYTLSTCWRCAPYILGAAQKLIEHGTARLPKSMKSGKSELGVVQAVEVPENYISPFTRLQRERDTIEIDSLKKGKGVSGQKQMDYEPYRFIVDQLTNDYENWAILARMNLHLDHMELVLAERNIPVKRLGGKSIFDSPHAVGIAQLIYGVANPRAADHLADGLGWFGEDLSVIQTIHQAAKGMGFGSLNGVGSKWKKETIELQQIAHDWFHPETDPKETTARINRFFNLLEKSIVSHQHVDYKSQLAVAGVCQKVLLGSQGDLKTRAKSILDLVTLGAKTKEAEGNANKIVLCTLTGSKGLEFPKVFIIKVDAGVVPVEKDGVPSTDEQIDEERRLLYVGMTRAQIELRLSFNRRKRSKFIEELGFD